MYRHCSERSPEGIGNFLNSMRVILIFAKKKTKKTQCAGQLNTSRRATMVGKRDWEIIIILFHLLSH